MAETIPKELRQLVFDRAEGRCEYCLLSQIVAAHKHEPDHIIPLQHDGQTAENNLALACARCNRFKGYNVGSFDAETGELIPFFHPRKQFWPEHFQLDGAVIRPLTAQGRVTAKMLHLNDPNRIEERKQLITLNLYP